MRSAFGRMPDGRPVDRVTIAGDGIRATVMAYGASLLDLSIEGPDGWRPVVLGFEGFDAYLEARAFMGAIVGRVANRIGGGFELDGATHELPLNEDGRTHLHGGAEGFDRKLWTIEEIAPDAVVLALVSPDGEEGYPGRVTARVAYRLGARRLGLELTAETDRPTLVNLSSHAYFNLDGAADVRDHVLKIPAERYTPVNADKLPTGEILAVAGTPWDFRRPRSFRDTGTDTDLNLVLSDSPADRPRLVAEVRGPVTGTTMLVHATAPGLQVYDGCMLDVGAPLTNGHRAVRNAGLCLEPQFFPDAINHPAFEDPILRPGDTWRQQIDYVFP